MQLAGQGSRARADGYAMAALLVGLSIMAVLMSAALPVWTHLAQREKEEELIWRGQQYARAVMLFQRKFANAFPPTIDLLVEQKFLRRKYKDPITNDDFQPIPVGGAAPGQSRTPGQAASGGSQQAGPARPAAGPGQTPAGNFGIQGVVSKSAETSIKVYNGRTKYNEWTFVAMQTQQRPGAGTQILRPGRGEQRPGLQLSPGQPADPGPGFGPRGSTGVPVRPPVFGPGGRSGGPGGSPITPIPPPTSRPPEI